MSPIYYLDLIPKQNSFFPDIVCHTKIFYHFFGYCVFMFFKSDFKVQRGNWFLLYILSTFVIMYLQREVINLTSLKDAVYIIFLGEMCMPSLVSKVQCSMWFSLINKKGKRDKHSCINMEYMLVSYVWLTLLRMH